MSKIGIPFIISAPSGAGKTSLVTALLEQNLSIKKSISFTTRPKRPKEVDGSDYYFITQSKFNELIEQNNFLEYAMVFGHYYGTSKVWLEEQLSQGFDVILEIDWQGARQLRQKLQHARSIFILPPSLEVLQQRLTQRGQDEQAIINKRMEQARNEIRHYQEFDYLIVNDDFERALADLHAIIRTQHIYRYYQEPALAELLMKLLE